MSDHASSPRFLERQRLQDGRTSVVFRGLRVADGQPVVIKRLKESYPHPEAIAAMQRELELTRRAACPEVMQALELALDDGVLRLITEDFGATALAERIRLGPLPLDEALDVAMAAARALAVLHDRDVVHQDVNPHNLVRNAQTGQVKLIDFGLATTLPRQAVPLAPVTRLQGTALFMSPEQTGRTGLDPRFGHPAETTVDALCWRGEDASPRMR